jgi:hypothetical protein
MKILNVIFCLLFIGCAALQYNDPDPYIWIPLYLYAAFCCWLIVRSKYFIQPILIGIIIYTTYALYLFFAENGVLDWIQQHDAENIAQSMKATKPWIEETREFFGLLIAAGVLTADYFYARKQLKKLAETI